MKLNISSINPLAKGSLMVAPLDQVNYVYKCHHLSRDIVVATFNVISCLDSEIYRDINTFLCLSPQTPEGMFRGKLNFKPSSHSPTKWSNTLKQFVCELPKSCMCVFDYFVGLTLKGLKTTILTVLFKLLSTLVTKVQ